MTVWRESGIKVSFATLVCGIGSLNRGTLVCEVRFSKSGHLHDFGEHTRPGANRKRYARNGPLGSVEGLAWGDVVWKVLQL